jgi:hypothetical protein
MAKKRKLNSKNPKYWSTEKSEGPKIKEKRLLCVVNARNERTHKKTGTKVPVYGIWYEEDE